MLMSYVYGGLCINFEIRILILPSHAIITLAHDALGVNELQPLMAFELGLLYLLAG
jgi:hypothetical protein